MNTKDKIRCLFCKSPAEIERRAPQSLDLYFCPECGHYCISDDYRKKLNYYKTGTYLIYNYLLSSEEKKSRIIFLGHKWQEQWAKDHSYTLVTPDDIENWYPKTFAEKIDKILLAFSKLSKFEGNNIDFELQIYSLYLFCTFDATWKILEKVALEEQVDHINAYLKNNGLISFIEKRDASGAFAISMVLEPKAFNIIYELQKKDISNQCFIAMWFPSEKHKKYEQMKNTREAISQAVSNLGYIPILIDEKEHNNQIVPEIIYEIKKSKFLIADITGHRNGVYYEAGIMEGLERQTIICCEQDDFNKKHFDIAQKNLIKYSKDNLADLKNCLTNRIKATI